MTAVEEVTAVVDRWAAAEAAQEGASALMTDDFVAVGPVGFVLDAAQWTRRHRDGLDVETLTITVDSVRVHGDTAVVVAVQDQAATYRERRSEGRFRVTLVLRRDDAWRVLGLHLSGPMPAAAQAAP